MYWRELKTIDIMEKLVEKAKILIDSLPFIRNFYGKTFVIKYGGAAQINDDLKITFAEDVVLLNFIGIRPIIVHGGGPKVSEIMKKMGKEPTFIQGQRVTDAETMEIVEMVLGGLINNEIVGLINRQGGKAIGLSGKDGNLIKAKKKLLKMHKSGEEEIIDIGLVGEIEAIDPDILISLERNGFIPVIAPIGFGSEGETYNINADFVASAIASAMNAEKLILLTDVPGIKDKNGEVISSLVTKELNRLVEDGTISGGMIPKVQSCLKALKGGVKKTHIIDGRIPHCLLLEIFTKEGVGTEIVETD
ncbi:MAG: acetylglutamate kinase [Thermodesulfovibrionales bacterium]|nr:acetylglutamate kinase [Thermodesulfovibrionales bacterium]